MSVLIGQYLNNFYQKMNIITILIILLGIINFVQGQTFREIYGFGRRDSGQVGIYSQVPRIIDARDITNCSSSTFSTFTLCVTKSLEVVGFGYSSTDKGMFAKPGVQFQTPRVLPNLVNIVEVANGFDHSMARDLDGNIYTFGTNSEGQLGIGVKDNLEYATPIKLNFTGVSKIAAVNLRSHFLKDGKAYGFGANERNSIGPGGTNILVPLMVILDEFITDIALGMTHTVLLTNTSRVYTFGSTTNGRLGFLRTSVSSISTPTLLNVTDIISITVGNGHTILLARNQTIYVFGENNAGQLCLGTPYGSGIFRSSPTVLSFNLTYEDEKNFTQILAVGDLTFFISNRKILYGCGANNNIQLGIEDIPNVSRPTLVPYSFKFPVSWVAGTTDGAFVSILSKLSYFGDAHLFFDPALSNVYGPIQRIFHGGASSIVLQDNRTFTIFGDNGNGQLGFGSSSKFVSPRLNTKFENETIVECIMSKKAIHTMCINSNGTILGFGGNQHGNLGLGDIVARINPTIIPFNGTIVQISTGGQYDPFNSFYPYTLFLNDKGEVFGTGGNEVGQLSNFIQSTYITNIAFINQTNISKIASSGRGHTLLLTTQGKVITFGYGWYGQLGIGTNPFMNRVPTTLGLNNITDIITGGDHSFAITNTSQVYSWGYANYGQICQGSLFDKKSPTLIAPLKDVEIVKIVAGWYHSLLLSSNQTLYVCGMNQYGQLGIGFTTVFYETNPVLLSFFTAKIVDIAAGEFSTLVLTECNSSYSGPNCQYPVCFGISSINTLVCSGQGRCVAPNQCVCFDSSVTSRDCLGGTFYWVGPPNGLWSQPGYWIFFDTEGNQYEALKAPGQYNEKIYFNPSNTNNVRISQDISILSLNILGPVTFTFTGDFKLQTQELIISNSLTIIGGTFIYNGNLNLNHQFTLLGTTFNYQGNMNMNNDISLTRSIINYQGSLNLKGNLNMEDASINMNGDMNLYGNINKLQGSFKNGVVNYYGKITQGGSLTFENTNITIYNDFVIDKYASITNSNLTIQNNSTLTILSSIDSKLSLNFDSLFSSNSFLIHNYGTINVGSESKNSNITLAGSILNYKVFRVLGNLRNSTNLTIQGNYYQTVNSYTYLLNSTLNLLNYNFTIQNGYFLASGVITTNHFLFNSSDGYFKLSSPFKLSILGDATFSSQSTLFLTLNGVTASDNDFITITKTLLINSLILLKVSEKYKPKINDICPLFSIKNYDKLSDPRVNLIGAPQKGASLSQSGAMKIEFSYGSVQNPGYDCTYLGKQKSLEMNKFTTQNKLIISLTVPSKGNIWYGFGFDLGGNISESILSISKNTTNYEVKNHLLISQNIFNNLLDVSSTQSTPIFNIGPDYTTITIIVEPKYVLNQKYIYYSEFKDLSNITFINLTHYMFERFQFSIQNSSIEKIDCTNFLQPLRYEIYSYPAASIMIILYVFLLILCVLFSRTRPLVTRGISPILTILFLLLQLLLEFRNVDLIPVFQGSLCFFYSFGIYPLQQICFIMIYLYFLRYFSIINLNQNKNNIYKMLQEGGKLDKFDHFKMRFLKLFASPWITFIVLIACYFITIFIFFITMLASNSQLICKFDTLTAIKTVNNVELIIIYFVTFLTLIGDMISNYKILIRCKWIEYIFFSDPYWFRAQIILFIPFMIYALSVELWAFSTSLKFLDIAINHESQLIFNTITYAILLILDVIFPLVISIITFLHSLKPRKQIDSIDYIMRTPVISALFLDFCKKEFSLENYSAYKDIEMYQLKPTKEFADKIWKTYLCGKDAVMEINLPKKVAQAVKEQMDNGVFESNLFEKVRNDVIVNLADTYSRFILDQTYMDYVRNNKLEIEMIEGK